MKTETFKKRFDIPVVPGWALLISKDGKPYCVTRSRKGKLTAKKILLKNANE